MELLNLLACFADSFVSQPQHQQLMFQQTHVLGDQHDNYRQLGGLFLSLTSYLLGTQQSEGRSSAQSTAETTANTAAVASLFGFSAPVASKGLATNADSPISTGDLPVQWLVQNLTRGQAVTPRTPTEGREEDGRMDVVPSSTAYVSMGDGDGGGAGESELAPPVPEDLYTDYVQAAGWKKLEYRVAGLSRSIAALQDRAIVEISRKGAHGRGGQALRQQLLNGGSSLEGLVTVLTTKELVTALSSAIGQAGASAVITTPSTDAAVRAVELYTQLLQAFPTEVGGVRAGQNRSTVLTADGKASLLITLAFVNPAAPLSRRLWLFIQQRYATQVEAMLTYDDACLLNVKAFTEAALPAEVAYTQLLSALYLFCAVFLQQLAAVDDETLLEQDKIFTVPELRNITVFLKRWLYKLYWSDPLFDIHSSFHHVPPSGCTALRLLKLHCQLSATRLFNHLCTRNERRPFLSSEDWGWAQMSGFDLTIRDDVTAAAATEAMYGSSLILKNARVKSVLTFIPQVWRAFRSDIGRVERLWTASLIFGCAVHVCQVVPFKQRVSVFHAHLDFDKTQYYATQEHGGAARLGLSGALRIEVHRDAIVADAYEQLHEVGHRLKGMVKVEFISEQGLNEAGIDGGGLFKEFMDSFAKEAFSPTYGLFIPTSHQLLTPNPASGQLGSNHLRYFHFVGKMLGKAVYEVSP